jgi:hypothetical protein
MDTLNRSAFLPQLAAWATKHIAGGRSPFRMVQIQPAVVTRTGTQQPDLVFWINQDSFVAGGFVLCPSAKSFDLSAAQACAHALGISYFATWCSDKITVWQAESLTPHSEHKAPNLSVEQDAKALEDAFIHMMEHFRTLAVIGTCPPQQLSYWHLTNLCLSARDKAQLTLDEHLRTTPRPQKKHQLPLPMPSINKIHLCLARILTLFFLDKIPHNLQPENLDQALCYLASEIEDDHLTCLAPDQDEIPLDANSAIVLHHLLRRLDQIALFSDKKRAKKFLCQLLLHTAPSPASTCVPSTDANAISVYSSTAQLTESNSTQIDLPARLAIKHLLRLTLGLPLGKQPTTNIFNLPSDTPATTITGALYNLSRPSIIYRNNWHTKINLVWPRGTINLPGTAATWTYELAYLMGTLAPHSQIKLNLPATLLSSPASATLMDLWQNNFTISEITLITPDTIYINATKELDDDASLCFSASQQRNIAWKDLRTAPPELFALALHLPEALLQLVAGGALNFQTDSVAANQHAVEVYKKSTLAQMLTKYLQYSGTNKTYSKWHPRIPLPNAAVLDALLNLSVDPTCTQHSIDTTLEQLLGIETVHTELAATIAKTTAPPAPRATIEHKKLRKKILAMIHTQGIPKFPTQYLYEFYRPQLTNYLNGNPPWQIDNEFMGIFQLSNNSANPADKAQLTIDDEYLAHAIVLASYTKETIALPIDTTICNTIVSRYLTDLNKLHTDIWSTTHAALLHNNAANRFVVNTWKALDLPPWHIVDMYSKRFKINN